MSDTIEDQTAALVAARRGRPPKAEAKVETVGAEQDEPSAAPKATRRLFPVKLLRNYHPVNDFTIAGKEPTETQRVKVYAGWEIEMDVEEARDIIAKGIADRNDPIV